MKIQEMKKKITMDLYSWKVSPGGECGMKSEKLVASEEMEEMIRSKGENFSRYSETLWVSLIPSIFYLCILTMKGTHKIYIFTYKLLLWTHIKQISVKIGLLELFHN